MAKKKGLDGKFIHYGIRQEDLDVIADLCREEGLDPNWVQEEILLNYHKNKVNELEVTDKSVEKILNKALNKIL